MKTDKITDNILYTMIVETKTMGSIYCIYLFEMLSVSTILLYIVI